MNEIVDRLVSEMDDRTASFIRHTNLHLFGKRDSRYLRGVSAKAKKFGVAVRWKDIPPPFVLMEPFVVDTESFQGETAVSSPNWCDLDCTYHEQAMSCTANACYLILREYGAIQYNHVGVIGRGHAVQGLREMLLQHDATLTVCHSRTQNIVKAVTPCDVLVNAAPHVDVMYIPPFGKHLVLDVSGSMKEIFADVPAVGYVGMRDIGRLNTSILMNRLARNAGWIR